MDIYTSHLKGAGRGEVGGEGKVEGGEQKGGEEGVCRSYQA